jgi:hypothetical protein
MRPNLLFSGTYVVRHAICLNVNYVTVPSVASAWLQCWADPCRNRIAHARRREDSRACTHETPGPGGLHYGVYGRGRRIREGGCVCGRCPMECERRSERTCAGKRARRHGAAIPVSTARLRSDPVGRRQAHRPTAAAADPIGDGYAEHTPAVGASYTGPHLAQRGSGNSAAPGAQGPAHQRPSGSRP